MQVHTNNNQISHKGLVSQAALKRKFSGISKKELERTSRYVGHLLGESSFNVDNIIKEAEAPRIQLLKHLARKYCTRNAELPIAQREGKEELFEIYETVKKPVPEHFDILRGSKDGFDSLKTIFSLAQDEKSLDFVLKLQRDILRDSPNQSNTIINLLASKHKLTYMENIDKFKSYLKLNADNSDALKKLDISIDNNKYDNQKYDSTLAMKILMQFKTVRDCVKPFRTLLTKYYTPEHGRFLWRLTNTFLHSNTKVKPINKNELLDLYKTTNADNIKLRLAVLDNFKYYSKNNDKAELSELKKLFKNIERNDEVKKFVTKSVEQGLAVNSVSELNSIIETTPLHKANYFFSNLRRIVALSDGEERQRALVNELDNPFFIPRNRRHTRVWKVRDNVGDYGTLEKMQVYLLNKIKVFMYNNFEKKSDLFVTDTQKTLKKLMFRKQAQERKVQLTKEVNDIIKQKLGKRTYNEQEDTFRLKATKIRLGLLPDIFESIKATRTQNRALGIEPVVSNKDASRLYELINGSNRKLIRYMLMKTDISGKRIFDVREITELIEKSNKDISLAKKQTPDYKAADTKVYYENIYNGYVEKYGKLKPTSKSALKQKA